VARYDTLGRSYSTTRQPDARIADQIADALGQPSRVVNVGAGAGNYEPTDAFVAAVEPSLVMIRQRPRGGAVVQGIAEKLPFADRSFDVAMAVLTIHHWDDVALGLAEMRRVALRQVLFTFDPAKDAEFWLVADYLPVWIELDEALPALADIAQHLDVKSVRPVAVPADCTDGFGGAFWNRPEMYLEPAVQAGISSLAAMDDEVLAPAMARLRDDVASGAWDARHGHLRHYTEFDLGYRLIMAGD
jgi:SAM-dependent methyltransferase